MISTICAATLVPPALRSNLPGDVLQRYQQLSVDPRHANMVFPELAWEEDIPAELYEFVVRSIDSEHEDYVAHL